jgi:tetratricopeptide (TPR) repeat protein
MAEKKIGMISSTIRDLPEHREKVMEACLRLGVMPSMMEHWPSIDTDGVTASLAKVDEADRLIREIRREALKYAERALSIRVNILGTRHPDTASSYGNVGNVCGNLGEYGRALQCEQRALEIVDELFGTRSPMGALILNNICLIYLALNEPKKAGEIVENALAIRNELFGEQHPDTIASVINLSEAHLRLGHSHKAFSLLDYHYSRISKNNPMYERLKIRRANIVRPGFRQLPKKRR